MPDRPDHILTAIMRGGSLVPCYRFTWALRSLPDVLAHLSHNLVGNFRHAVVAAGVRRNLGQNVVLCLALERDRAPRDYRTASELLHGDLPVVFFKPWLGDYELKSPRGSAEEGPVTSTSLGSVSKPRDLAAARSRTEAAVRSVLADRSLLQPVFQPIADLARGTVCGYELLTRFARPLEGTPDRWFAAAERAGLAGRLEAIVVTRALEARSRLPVNCFISFNLTPHAALAPEVRSLLAGQRDLRGVVIEITEQARVEDYDELLDALAPARAAGAALAVDDVGTGYAGLEQIMALRPEFVKTDRSLVRNLHSDEVRAAGVEMLGRFASRIDAWLIAEGLETEAEIEAAAGLGIPLGQGYGLGLPGELGRPLSTKGRSALRSRIGAVPAAAETVASCVERRVPDWSVETDELRRPVAVVGPQACLISDPMVVLPAERIADVARRALTRAPDERFTPLVCCDELGSLLGLIRVERLVKALADASE